MKLIKICVVGCLVISFLSCCGGFMTEVTKKEELKYTPVATTEPKITAEPFKESIKPTAKQTVKPTVKPKTFSDLAKKKLKNKYGIKFSEAIDIMISIDVLVNPLSDSKIDNYWIQKFEFSDGSIIRLSKELKNGDFYFISVIN